MFFLDYLTCNWWLRLSGVFYRTSFKHVATYMSWRANILCIKFKITTILLTQLHVRISIWRQCLIHLPDRSLYWSASPKPTVEWSVMSVVIRIELLPSQQWSDRSCLLSFELSSSQSNSGVIGHGCCHSNWAPPKPTVEWSVMSVVIRIESLPSQQWSDRSCLLSFELSPSQANNGVIGHVCCHSNWAPPKPTVE